MSIRYLAVHHKGGDLPVEGRRDIEAATGLVWAGRVGTANLFVSSLADCITLPEDAGFVVGHLFHRSGAMGRLKAVSLPSTIQRSDAILRHLLAAYWGGYVAILKGPESGVIDVLRDPSGMLPCYYLPGADGAVMSSDCETLLQAGCLNPKVRWAYLSHHLFCQDLRSSVTGLEGLLDLLPGFKLSSSSTKIITTAAWDPWDFVAEADDAGLERRLETVIDHCVGAWAGSFAHILAPVSGGLDSSVIAAALAVQDTPWRCLNMATDEFEGDERHYARLLARHLAAPLDEAFHDVADVAIATARSWHLPRPHAYPFAQSEDRTTFALLAQHRLDAVFTGHGGDNVFCFLQSATPLVDRLLCEGLKVGAWNTLNDLCSLTGCSLLEAMIMAAQRLLQRSAAYAWSGDETYLNPQTLDRAGRALPHPWLEAPAGAVPGKAVHIATLLRIQGSLESPARAHLPPLIAPFLSQPIVELCLSIPTWKWCEGGINRAVVRNAYARRLPRELIDRRWKGGPNSFCLDVVAANHAQLREFLLGGLLAEHDIVDRPALQALFDRSTPIGPPDHLRIGFLAEAEAWARHWVGLSGGRPRGHPRGTLLDGAE